MNIINNVYQHGAVERLLRGELITAYTYIFIYAVRYIFLYMPSVHIYKTSA